MGQNLHVNMERFHRASHIYQAKNPLKEEIKPIMWDQGHFLTAIFML